MTRAADSAREEADLGSARRTAFLGLGGLAIVVFSTFAVLTLRIHPLCCADNTYIAIAAKNLAAGSGYVSSFPDNGYARMGIEDPQLLRLPFDPNVSTGGPSQALSVLFQRLFPESLVAQDLGGIVTRAMTLVLLLLLWPAKSAVGALLFAALLWALVVIAHDGHGTLFTGIGDLSAALILAVGVGCFYQGLESKRSPLLCASIVALFAASLTKLAASVYAALFLAGAFAILARDTRWHTLRRLALLAAGLFAAMELAMLLMLGGQGYWLNKQALLHSISEIRTVGGTSRSLSIPAGHGIFHSSAALLASLGLVCSLLARGLRPSLLLLSWSLVAAWLFLAHNAELATSNLRYLVLPSATLFALSFYALALWSRRQPDELAALAPRLRAGTAILLALGLSLSGARSRDGFSGLWMLRSVGNWHHIEAREKEIRDYARYLDSLDDGPVTAWSWQNAADAEFLSKQPAGARVMRFDPLRTETFYALVDRRWTPAVNAAAMLGECREHHEEGPYAIYRCREE